MSMTLRSLTLTTLPLLLLFFTQISAIDNFGQIATALF